jgi:hypothetical protein
VQILIANIAGVVKLDTYHMSGLNSKLLHSSSKGLQSRGFPHSISVVKILIFF